MIKQENQEDFDLPLSWMAWLSELQDEILDSGLEEYKEQVILIQKVIDSIKDVYQKY